MKKVVFKGFHFSLPPLFSIKRGKVYHKRIEFIDYEYDLGTNDQYDWNKLAGLKEGLNTHKISMMLAWRWLNGKLEIMPYQHDEYLYSDNPLNRFFHRDFLKTINLEIPVDLYIENGNGKWIMMVCQGDDLLINKTFKKSLGSKSCFYIEHWFGGNRKAVRNIIIKFKNLCR